MKTKTIKYNGVEISYSEDIAKEAKEEYNIDLVELLKKQVDKAKHEEK